MVKYCQTPVKHAFLPTVAVSQLPIAPKKSVPPLKLACSFVIRRSGVQVPSPAPRFLWFLSLFGEFPLSSTIRHRPIDTSSCILFVDSRSLLESLFSSSSRITPAGRRRYGSPSSRRSTTSTAIRHPWSIHQEVSVTR